MVNLDSREAEIRQRIAALESRQRELDARIVIGDDKAPAESIQIANEIQAAQRALTAIPVQRLEQHKAELLATYERQKHVLAERQIASKRAHTAAEALRSKLRPLEAEERRAGQLLMDISEGVQSLKSELRRMGVEV